MIWIILYLITCVIFGIWVYPEIPYEPTVVRIATLIFSGLLWPLVILGVILLTLILPRKR